MITRALGARAAALALISGVLIPSGAAEAQLITQPYVAVGHADGLGVMLGLNFLRDFGGDEDALVDEPGPALNAIAQAGFRRNDDRLTGDVGLGVVFPTGNQTLAYWGPIGIASVHPWGGGGGIRVAGGFGGGLAWLTAGAIKLDGPLRPWRALVSLDLTLAFVCDLAGC